MSPIRPADVRGTKSVRFGELKLAKTSNDSAIGSVEGYFGVFDEMDYDDDVSMKGCVERAASELFPQNQIKFFFNHAMPIGPLTNFGEDSKGMVYAGDILDTELGRDVKTLIGGGAVDQSSFRFRVSKWSYDEERKGKHGWPVRMVKEYFPVLEVGPVGLGAQPLTTASLKGFESHMPTLVKMAQLYEVGALDLGTVRRTLPNHDLPLADEDAQAHSSVKALRDWSGGETPNSEFAKAFAFVDPRRAGDFGAYDIQIGAVVDGELKACSNLLWMAAEIVHDDARFTDSERNELKSHLGSYFEKMRAGGRMVFAPWEEEQLVGPMQRLLTSFRGVRDALTNS